MDSLGKSSCFPYRKTAVEQLPTPWCAKELGQDWERGIQFSGAKLKKELIPGARKEPKCEVCKAKDLLLILKIMIQHHKACPVAASPFTPLLHLSVHPRSTGPACAHCRMAPNRRPAARQGVTNKCTVGTLTNVLKLRKKERHSRKFPKTCPLKSWHCV